MVYQTIFELLERIGIIALVRNGIEHQKSESEPYMPLSFDLLFRDPASGIAEIALAHNYLQNGDLCCDPDMRIKIDLQHGVAEALSYETSIPPLHQEVYPEPGKVRPALKVSLNRFLVTWLGNALDQGHSFTITEAAE